MTNPKFKPGPAKLRDGTEARIYAVDVENGFQIHGACNDGQVWRVAGWTGEGCFRLDGSESDLDLMPNVEPRKPREFWVNIYTNGFDMIHDTREKADTHATPGRLECIHMREVIE